MALMIYTMPQKSSVAAVQSVAGKRGFHLQKWSFISDQFENGNAMHFCRQPIMQKFVHRIGSLRMCFR